MAALSPAWACPRCGDGLTAQGAAHLCAGCRTEYPELGGVPVLSTMPEAALACVRSKLIQSWARSEAARDDAARAGSGANQTLLEELCRPVLARLSAAPQADPTG